MHCPVHDDDLQGLRAHLSRQWLVETHVGDLRLAMQPPEENPAAKIRRGSIAMSVTAVSFGSAMIASTKATSSTGYVAATGNPGGRLALMMRVQ